MQHAVVQLVVNTNVKIIHEVIAQDACEPPLPMSALKQYMLR